MSGYTTNSPTGSSPQGDTYDGDGGGAGPSYTPPTPRSASPAGPQPDPFHGPGSIDFNLMDPAASAQEGVDTSKDVFTGLKAFLFGTDAPDARGQHGGILGDAPGIGAGARFVSEAGANAVGAVASIPGAILGGAERLENPFASDEQEAEMRRQFEALPEDSEAKAHAREMMEADKGLADTGMFSAHGHYMAEALQAYEQHERVSDTPDLFQGAFRPTASLMDAVTNLFGAIALPAKPIAEAWAGFGTPGQEGRNRVQMIMAVGDGHAHFVEDKGVAGTGLLAGDPTQGLNAVEQVVYDKVRDGSFTPAEAEVFLAQRGAAFSHSAAANIAGEAALDPINLATFGAGAVAKAGSTGAAMVKALDEANRLLRVAKAAGKADDIKAAEAVVESLSKGVRTGARAAATGSRDLLGRAAGTERAGDILRGAGRAYAGLEGTGFGKAAKIARTVIDPLHSVGANPKAAAALDEGSRVATRAVAVAHGELHHIENTNHLLGLAGTDIADQYLQGLAVYSGNVLRRVAGRTYRASQMLMADKGEKLFETLPFESLRAAVGNLKNKASTQLEEEAGQFIKKVWNEDDDLNLATRMEALWQGRSAPEWVEDLAKMTPEQKSLLHAATYGSAVQQMHKAKALVRASGDAGWGADKLERLILLNRGTLTDLGHEGILSRMSAAANDADRMDIIEQARHDYPQLRSYVVDHTSNAATVDNFLEMMERIKNRLPSQVRNAERADMPEELRAFNDLITPSSSADEAVFTIGFRPKDEFLWGLERDSDGVLREVTDPWMDQTSDIAGAYSPVREVPRNIAGAPIVGAVAVKGAKALDHAEAIGRMALHGTTGKMVTTAARNKFIEKVGAKYTLPDGTPALTKGQVEGIWKALMDKVEESENISSVRGLSEGAIWKATKGKGVITRQAEHAGMDSRRLLVDILDAYDGDIRTIGLTQKMSGRVKLMMGKTFMGNTAGQVSEHMWPLLKFRLNPFFQLQEKIEPFILNAQRGASIALGTKPNALDRAAMDLYTNFAEKNLIHIADNDISELSGKFALGKALNRAAYGENAPMRGWASKLEGLTDVQGTKQLNMMRTWRKGLGKNMRAEWEASMPGEFDRMLLHHRATVGEVVSEDDFAVHLAHTNLAANGVFTKVIDGVPHMDYTNAIMEGQWAAPQHLGEMRPLSLDYMAERLALTDSAGADIRTSMEMRRALADGRMSHQEIARELRTLGAHPDYIARVESALRFSWPEFWNAAKTSFGLSDVEVTRFQNLFAGIARQRDMTPTEYLSQVYSPHIARGTEGAVGSLGSLVEFARAGGRTENIPDLAQLRGVAGQSTIRDFYQQMGQVFSHHLDPSAKRAFLREIDLEGNAPDSITDILDTWDRTNATELLMDRIMNYMHGTPGTGSSTLVADEATGIAGIRDSAANLREAAGRPRSTQRVVYADDPALASRVAEAYDAMPEATHIATPAELSQQVTKEAMGERAFVTTVRALDTRPGSMGLPREVRAMLDTRMLETRGLYRHITEVLGIKVTPSRARTPYADASALRADLARGRLKVARDGYWHPYMDATDLAMERAVADVFGYGQEAVEFGSHDAVMSAAAMYSDEARPTYLTDEFGRTAYEAHSTRRVEQAVQNPTTWDEYETRFGRAAPQRVIQSDPLSPTGASEPLSRSVGAGVRAMPEEAQHELVTNLSALRDQFPGLPFGRVDTADLKGIGATAATMTYPADVPTVVFSTHAGWGVDDVANDAYSARRTAENRRDFGVAQAEAQAVGGNAIPGLVSGTRRGDIYHEFGHVLDDHLHRMGEVDGIAASGQYADEDLSELLFQFRESGAARRMSVYGNEANDHEIMAYSETVGELFDLSFNPDNSAYLMGEAADGYGRMIDPGVQEFAMAFRSKLQELGIWKPGGSPVAVNPHAGKTIAEANAAGAAIAAPRRVGPMPQDLVDELTEKFLGNGRYAESNPDIARVAGYMRDHMRGATAHTLEHGGASQYAHLFDQMSGMPVKDAAPFNVTEAALWHGQTQMMAAKWQDAFRLQYFAQNRSMLQRSINHPMFGLYPASYMWGKIGPELVKFMALEPFGAKTGAMAYTLLDIQKAVTVQRQFDPEFDKNIEDLGHSAALGWLSYMLPATPWSVPSSYPSWMRDMADQGLANSEQVAAGGTVNDVDFISPLNAVVKKAAPMTTQLPFFARALDEVAEGLPWAPKEAPYEPAFGPGPDGLLPPSEPVPQTGAVASPQGDPLAAHVTGLGTEDLLAKAMDNLSAMLGT